MLGIQFLGSNWLSLFPLVNTKEIFEKVCFCLLIYSCWEPNSIACTISMCETFCLIWDISICMNDFTVRDSETTTHQGNDQISMVLSLVYFSMNSLLPYFAIVYGKVMILHIMNFAGSGIPASKDQYCFICSLPWNLCTGCWVQQQRTGFMHEKESTCNQIVSFWES